MSLSHLVGLWQTKCAIIWRVAKYFFSQPYDCRNNIA